MGVCVGASGSGRTRQRTGDRASVLARGGWGERRWGRGAGGERRAGITDMGPILITPDGKSYVYEYGRTLSDLYLVDGIQ